MKKFQTWYAGNVTFGHPVKGSWESQKFQFKNGVEVALTELLDLAE